MVHLKANKTLQKIVTDEAMRLAELGDIAALSETFENEMSGRNLCFNVELEKHSNFISLSEYKAEDKFKGVTALAFHKPSDDYAEVTSCFIIVWSFVYKFIPSSTTVQIKG